LPQFVLQGLVFVLEILRGWNFRFFRLFNLRLYFLLEILCKEDYKFNAISVDSVFCWIPKALTDPTIRFGGPVFTLDNYQHLLGSVWLFVLFKTGENPKDPLPLNWPLIPFPFLMASTTCKDLQKGHFGSIKNLCPSQRGRFLGIDSSNLFYFQELEQSKKWYNLIL